MLRLIFAFSLLVMWIGGLGTPAQAWDDMSDEGSCRLIQSWELGTVMFITKAIEPEGDLFSGPLMENGVSIYLKNDDWASLTRGPNEPLYADFKLRFEDEYGNWFEGHPIIGERSLFLKVEMEWLSNFDSSSTVLVTRDGVKVGQFRWFGFSYPWSKFERCVSEARAPIIERERQEKLRRETPLDPFAG